MLKRPNPGRLASDRDTASTSPAVLASGASLPAVPPRTPQAVVPWDRLDPDDVGAAYHRHVVGGALAKTNKLWCSKDPAVSDEQSRQYAMALAAVSLAQMQCRDPMERALVTQVLLAEARSVRLTGLASKQTDLAALKVTHDASERAANTVRRLVLALAEYRRPRQFTSIRRQVNRAGQQVVQNNFVGGQQEVVSGRKKRARKKTTNELQSGGRERGHGAGDAEALPGDAGGPGGQTGGDLTDGAVAVLHGAADAGGEGAEQPERDPARGAVGKGGGDPAPGADPARAAAVCRRRGRRLAGEGAQSGVTAA